MAKLKLTEEEREALQMLLEGNLSDMSYEIADTDTSTFRDQLKASREVLLSILAKLKDSGE